MEYKLLADFSCNSYDKICKGEIVYSDGEIVRNARMWQSLFLRARTPFGTFLMDKVFLELVSEKSENTFQDILDKELALNKVDSLLELSKKIESYPGLIIYYGQKSVDSEIPIGWEGVDEKIQLSLSTINIETSLFVESYLLEESKPYFKLNINTGKFVGINIQQEKFDGLKEVFGESSYTAILNYYFHTTKT